MKVNRFQGNPIVIPAHVAPSREDFEVIGAFNAAVVEHDGEIVLLLRVAERPKSIDADNVRIPVFDPDTNDIVIRNLSIHDKRYDYTDPRGVQLTGLGQTAYLTSLSHLRLARSRDGLHFEVDPKPFLFPSHPLENFGIEDPRITKLGDKYYITYTAVSDRGVAVGLAVTEDFVKVERLGIILAPANKDVVLFPETINGKYYMLHRPSPSGIGYPDIWLASSPDLHHWGDHRYVFGVRPGSWDSKRIGAGVPPFRVADGWLELYHGADDNNRYSMGAVLLDKDDPSRVLARSREPFLAPEAQYEQEGFFGHVVFACGALVDVERDHVRLYYGVADTSMACADMSISDILNTMDTVKK
jgi:predicted GH43/DUF377 family glycosyl hydrolase